jgi:hypothetical protein
MLLLLARTESVALGVLAQTAQDRHRETGRAGAKGVAAPGFPITPPGFPICAGGTAGELSDRIGCVKCRRFGFWGGLVLTQKNRGGCKKRRRFTAPVGAGPSWCPAAPSISCGASFANQKVRLVLLDSTFIIYRQVRFYMMFLTRCPRV